MKAFKSFLLIPPIGLMSALEQSYFVRYPHKLERDYKEQRFKNTVVICPTAMKGLLLNSEWLIFERSGPSFSKHG